MTDYPGTSETMARAIELEVTRLRNNTPSNRDLLGDLARQTRELAEALMGVSPDKERIRREAITLAAIAVRIGEERGASSHSSDEEER